MKIDLICRYRSEDLLRRLTGSAFKNAIGEFGVISEFDKEGLPKIAESYNRMASKSNADILCFVHDDVEFLSEDWDSTVSDLFEEFEPDVLGVVGVTKYDGGRTFDAGNPHMAGVVCVDQKGTAFVKCLSPKFRYKKAATVDGLIMFVSRKYWESNKFDESFDGLFFYDIDLCLRGNVGITCSILVKHSKPKELYGKYPEAMKPIETYWDAFHAKHGLTSPVLGDQACAMTSLDDFYRNGQTDCYEWFRREKQCVSA